MRLNIGFLFLLTTVLLHSSVIGQSVNDKVTKDNLNSAFLTSLIMERINEIRSYKKAAELKTNKICQNVAADHAAFMAKGLSLTKEQDVEGYESTVDRLSRYGAAKKTKGDENIAQISLEGPVTYMDLSDEITSKWISQKESTKIIENSNLLNSGIAFAINADENALFVCHVLADKNVGEALVMPEKPKSAEQLEAEAKEKAQSQPVSEAAENTPPPKAKESKSEKPKPEDLEAAPVVAQAQEVPSDKSKTDLKTDEIEKDQKKELKDKKTDEKVEKEPKNSDRVEVEKKPEPTKEPVKTASNAKSDSESAAIQSASDTADVDELPACISENKYAKLNEIAQYGVFYRDQSILVRQDNLALLQEVVTKDMDGLSLVIDQNQSFEDGPTPFDYSLLRDQKFYKPDIFANMDADFNLKDVSSNPSLDQFSYKLSYWRLGIHCIDVDVALRPDSFDVIAFKDSVNKALGIAAGGVAALELVWNADFEIDSTNKTFRNVSIKIPFRKGKANYKAEDLIGMMDTLVEPGFKINAAHVTAYSSVEGDSLLNAKLARKRGKNVVEALRELNGGTLFYGQLVTNDSWDRFYETVKESPHPEFAQMSKQEIKAQLRPGQPAAKEMEAFLSNQRYAELNLSLEYLSKEAKDEKEAEFREIRNIYYDFGKFYVRREAGQSLDVFSKLLKQKPEFNLIELGAHTDSRGSYAFNEKLSQRRAQSVVDYLISKGIDRSRLVPKGYGESELLNHCKDGVECSEAEHQRNRRTTFRILNEGQEISSVEPDDISVDYAPSFRPKDGLIDLGAELNAELDKQNGEGAARVYKKMIKRVILGQMPVDILKLSREVPSDKVHLDLKLHILLAQELLMQNSEGVMQEFDALLKIDPSAPFVVFNAMAYKLSNDQGFVNALKADASKKSQVVSILNSIKDPAFPQEKLEGLISYVNRL